MKLECFRARARHLLNYIFQSIEAPHEQLEP
jgi:hypothetical protein